VDDNNQANPRRAKKKTKTDHLAKKNCGDGPNRKRPVNIVTVGEKK